jgi:hypothetical protein
MVLAGRPTGSSSRSSRQCAPTWLSSELRAAFGLEWSWAWAVVAWVWAQQAAPTELKASQVLHGGSCQPEQGRTAAGRGAASAAAPCFCRMPRGVCAALLGRLSDWAHHLAVTPLHPCTRHSRSTNPLEANIALIQLCLRPLPSTRSPRSGSSRICFLCCPHKQGTSTDAALPASCRMATSPPPCRLRSCKPRQ